MHKLSTTVPQSSTLAALCFLGLLGVLHEYAGGALVGGTRLRVARLVIAVAAALRYENLCIIPARKEIDAQILPALVAASCLIIA